MRKLIIILTFGITMFANAQNKLPFELEKDWETTGFENPESVVLDSENKVLYVSNVNGAPTDKDASGHISKVGLDGTIIEQKWITGLHAPKGLTLHKRILYVTDIDEIVEINIDNQQVTRHKANGAKFLNDIVADKQGNVYASNTFEFSGIYKLPQKGKREVVLWMKSDDLNMPNGLYVSGKHLFVANWGAGYNSETHKTDINGQLLKIDLKRKTIEEVTKPIGNLDGVQETLHGFLLTDWLAGKLLYYSNKTQVISEALDLPQGSADLFFDKKTKSIYIPLMVDSKLLKYHFKK